MEIEVVVIYKKYVRNKNLTKTIIFHLPVDRDQQIQGYKPILAN